MHERTPQIADESLASMNLWLSEMARRKMIFHPEDAADSIVFIDDGSLFFLKEKADQVQVVQERFFHRFSAKVVNDAVYPYFMRAAGMM